MGLHRHGQDGIWEGLSGVCTDRGEVGYRGTEWGLQAGQGGWVQAKNAWARNSTALIVHRQSVHKCSSTKHFQSFH